MTKTSQHPKTGLAILADVFCCAQCATDDGPSHPVLTASQIKAQYEQNNPDGHCFDRKSMRFFGDTMRNFRAVRTVTGYRLERRRPVKNGLSRALVFTSCCEYVGTVQP